MEIFTRKMPTDDMFAAELSLKSWINESMLNSIMEVVDSNLVQVYNYMVNNLMTYCLIYQGLALSCCADSPEERIKMTDVVASLTKIKISFT